MVKYILYIAFLCLGTTLFGQGAFTKHYSYYGNDQGRSLIEDTDSTYMVVGYSNSGTGGKNRMLLMQLDTIGNVKWTNTYHWGFNLYGLDLMALNQDTLVVLATSQTLAGTTCQIVYLNPEGDSLSTIDLNTEINTSGLQLAKGSDSYFAVVSESQDTVTGNDYAILSIINSTTVINTHQLSPVDSNDFLRVKDIHFHDDHWYVGGEESSQDSTFAFMSKYTKEGAFLWKKYLKTDLHTTINAFALHNDYIVMGVNTEKASGQMSKPIVKIDTSFSATLFDHYTLSDFQNDYAGILIDDNTEEIYSAINTKEFGIGDRAFDYIADKYDTGGWWTPYASSYGGYGDDICYKFLRTRTGANIMIGSSSGLGLGNGSIFIVKIDNQENYISAETSSSEGLETLTTEEERIANIRFYPNPCSNFLQIENIPENSTLELFTIQGKFIMPLGHQNNLTHLNQGQYIIRITSNSASSNQILIKYD